MDILTDLAGDPHGIGGPSKLGRYHYLVPHTFALNSLLITPAYLSAVVCLFVFVRLCVFV